MLQPQKRILLSMVIKLRLTGVYTHPHLRQREVLLPAKCLTVPRLWIGNKCAAQPPLGGGDRRAAPPRVDKNVSTMYGDSKAFAIFPKTNLLNLPHTGFGTKPCFVTIWPLSVFPVNYMHIICTITRIQAFHEPTSLRPVSKSHDAARDFGVCAPEVKSPHSFLPGFSCFHLLVVV